MSKDTCAPTGAPHPDRPAPHPGTSTGHDTGPQQRGLNTIQRDYLLRPLNANRVRDLKGMNHLEAYDVRTWLTRIFGFGGWAVETIALDVVHQGETKTRQGRDAFSVVYRAQVRLTVRDPYGNVLTTFDDGAAGDAVLPTLGDAHDMAMKTALSQALKRCAVNLGDAFGLSLYNGGGQFTQDANGNRIVRPLVQATLDTHGTNVQVQDAPIHAEQSAQSAA